MGLPSRTGLRTRLGQGNKPIKMADKKLGFVENFLLSGVAAGVSKTAAAPIERVKLLVQNQDEMIKQGRLDKPYTGVIDCTTRVLKTEGVYPFWRGNLANVLRYFPTQALNFAFKDQIKSMFKTSKDAPQALKFGTNIASGGFAGTLSLLFVYSLDYARTRLANDAKGKGGERQFNGLIDVYVKTLKSDASRVSTEASSSLPLVSSSTVACTLASTTHSSLSFLELMLVSLFPSFSDGE